MGLIAEKCEFCGKVECCDLMYSYEYEYLLNIDVIVRLEGNIAIEVMDTQNVMAAEKYKDVIKSHPGRCID